ncbi:MAG: EcoKI restriction-modification system protein HsdS [Candidatus Accumulibacter cognatus]|uniref:EcoKI restriction-modification system protein HsdS n=2 Tax=Candidatus Accumulibacter cognatus TaxID=2954383 RepID=A0A080MF08_9PROT|nr:MAG: EcoKI restriction-modification system protein HsdS [Candidatus Accumulibacter cognatus]
MVCETAEQITDLGVRNSNVKQQPKGTVLLSFKLSIGRVAFAGCDLYTNEAIAGLRSEELTPEFLFYGLQQWNLLQNVDQAIKGATLNKDKLKKIEFKYPESLVEQTKIAEVLSTLDRAIEQTEALIAKQQRIKTGLMQDLLTKGIDEHGNIRSEATHAFKDSPLGRIPLEWDAKLLDDCISSDAPICYGILMPGTGVDDGVPVIKVKDIFDGEICLNDLLLTDPKIDAAYKRSRLRTNDLLITIRGTTGRVALVPIALDGANITQDAARIRLKAGHLSVYFFYLLQSADVQAQVDLQTLGQAVKGINIAEVRRLRVPVPPEDEQKRICQLLEQIHSAWQASAKYRDKLLLQKAGMMHDLLTAKRRVTPLLEPAAAQ